MITRRKTLYSLGRHRNSLRTGNASPISRVTASHCSNRDCAFWGQKPGLLFQLPPQFVANRDRLAGFLRLLKAGRRYAFEFRHPSCYEPTILDLLRTRDISLCLSDHHDAPAPWEVTVSFVYVRVHGPRGTYKDHYSNKTLRDWARKIVAWKHGRRDVYVYFDNDQKSAAPMDARRLMTLVDHR